MSRKHLLRRYLLELIGYARWRALGAFLLSLAAALSEGLGLLILIPLLHVLGVAPEQGSGGVLAQATTRAFAAFGLSLSLPSVLAAFIAVITLRTLLTCSRDLVVTEIQYGFVDHLRTRLNAAIGRANWLFLVRIRSSDLAHMLTGDIGRVAIGTHGILRLAVAGILLTAQATIALGISPLSTLAALTTGALLILMMRPQLARAQKIGSELSRAARELFGNITDFLGGIKLAKSYTAEDRHIALFDRSVDDMRAQLIAFNRSNATVRAFHQIGSALALGALLFLAVGLMHLPTAELLVLVVVFARLLPTVMGLQQSYQQTLHMLPAFESVLAMQAQCEAAREPLPPLAAAAPRLTKELRLDGVWFRYDKLRAEEAVLRAVHLVIPARQTIAIVGPSGAGKSTLADLLMGLLEPDAGTIEIDGAPLTRDSLRLWRGNVAYVPQDTFLFHDTVRANLLWARPGATEDELARALEAAAAVEFVRALPEGLGTIVGERGIRLSGGERQRVALARALLCQPSLLILDEATSALDSESELRVQSAIEALHGKLTMVVIAHRLSTVRSADQVVVLDAGRVVEAGPWRELTSNPEGRLNALLQAAGGVAPASSRLSVAAPLSKSSG